MVLKKRRRRLAALAASAGMAAGAHAQAPARACLMHEMRPGLRRQAALARTSNPFTPPPLNGIEAAAACWVPLLLARATVLLQW